MKLMKYYLSFPHDTFSDSLEAFKYIAEFIDFPIKAMQYTGSDFMKYDYNELIEHLDKNKPDTFGLFSKYSDFTASKNTLYFTKFNNFVFDLESINRIKFDELLQSAIKKGFTILLGFDFGKALWQNEQLFDNYKSFYRDYMHLPRRWDDTLSPIFGDLVDISKNPGHWVETQDIVLMAAPEMWFGPGSWKFFDKERVMSFPKALEIKEILPDVVYVNLFDVDEPDYESKKILKLQKEFRKWTKMDKIEKSLCQEKYTSIFEKIKKQIARAKAREQFYLKKNLRNRQYQPK